MALTLVASPHLVHPAYNPVVYAVRTNLLPNPIILPGFKYIFGIRFNGEANETLFRVFPDRNGDGMIDISKIISSRIYSKLSLNDGQICLDPDTSFTEYEISFGEEYPEYWAFNDYEFSYFTELVGSNPHPYVVGDQITIRISPSITDSRRLLNGTFNVVEVVSSTRIRISLLYSDIGPGPATPGDSFFSDRRKLVDYPLSSVTRVAYNEAVSFTEFPTWTPTKILPTNDNAPQGDILTNSPNAVDVQYGYDPVNGYFGEMSKNSKYIVKPYQELYWNFFDNETGLVDAVICINEFGDRWMLPSDCTSQMKQFNVSPDNPEWISIIPNYNNATSLPFTINPYTHIAPDSSIIKAKWIDIYPTFAAGVDTCDEITATITYNLTGGGTDTFTGVFRPYGHGTNQRRFYQGTIGGRQAFLWQGVGSSPTFVRYWYLSFGDGLQETPPDFWSSFYPMTSNTLPNGIVSSSNNNAEAWKAFDRNPDTFYITTSGTTTDLIYEFANGVTRWSSVFSYTINKGTSSTNAIKSWRVSGSNDGVTYTVLHTVTGNTATGIYQSPPVWNGVNYKYIRLAVLDVISGSLARVNEFSIYDPSTKVILTSANDCPVGGTGFLIWNWIGGPTWPGMSSSPNLLTTATGVDTYPTLKPRRIFLDYDCGINTTQILFLDRAGSYSSFNFPLRQVEKGNTQKLSYKNEIGGISGSSWAYNTNESENTVYSSTVDKTFTLTTDWITTSMSDYFEELITSPEVYIKLVSEANTGRDAEVETPWLACTVVDADFVNPKQKNKRLINRTITVKLNSNNPINI